MDNETEDKWIGNCVLCKQPNNDEASLVTVKRQGILSFIKSSKIRDDPEVQQVLRNRQSIIVHVSCSKSYNAKHNLRYHDNQQVQQVPLTRRASAQFALFDFSNNCFFCGIDIQKNRNGQDQWSYVENITLKTKLCEKYANSKIPQIQAFVNRLSLVDCLVKVNARYHKKCYRSPPFEKYYRSEHPTPKQKALDCVLKYALEKRDQSQFCLTEILSTHGNLEDRPTCNAIKLKLQEKFPNDFIVHESQGEVIISRTSLARDLLLEYFHKNRINNVEESQDVGKSDEASATCLTDIQNTMDNTGSPPSKKMKS